MGILAKNEDSTAFLWEMPGLAYHSIDGFCGAVIQWGQQKGGKTMFEINKREFGAFVAQLRKEQGLTQKGLGEKLFLSDKAVSKWETGVSHS